MWQKLTGYLRGRKTIWVARLYVVAGLAVTAKDLADAYGLDVSAYLPTWLTGAGYWPFVLVGTGLLFEGLRRISYTAPYVGSGQPPQEPTGSAPAAGLAYA